MNTKNIKNLGLILVVGICFTMFLFYENTTHFTKIQIEEQHISYNDKIYYYKEMLIFDQKELEIEEVGLINNKNNLITSNCLNDNVNVYKIKNNDNFLLTKKEETKYYVYTKDKFFIENSIKNKNEIKQILYAYETENEHGSYVIDLSYQNEKTNLSQLQQPTKVEHLINIEYNNNISILLPTIIENDQYYLIDETNMLGYKIKITKLKELKI